MTKIDNLTDAADQTTTLILPDNTAVTLRLRYRARTQRWTADVAYAPLNFKAQGLNVCCFPNIVRFGRNILPFGLAFMTADFTDPFDLNDFASGRVNAYLLDAVDVAAVDVAAVEARIIGRPA
jgi:hypothetical protein